MSISVFCFASKTKDGNSYGRCAAIDDLSHILQKVEDLDAIILGWNTVPDPDAYDVWHSSKTGPDELNHVTFRNAEVDELLEKGRRTFDREERRTHLLPTTRETQEDRSALWRLCEELTSDSPG